ncbi:MAG: glycosyltransferase family 4 protein [Candidatus Micrarchaeota archaeon]
MRILLLTEFYGTAPGGVETHVAGLESELKKQGHVLDIVTPNREKWNWLIGGRPFLRSIYYFIKALPKIAKADRIYTIYTLSPFIAGVFLKLISGKRLIAGIWNTEALEKIRDSKILQWFVSKADDILFFTDAHKKLYPRGIVIPNWVDISIFRPGISKIKKKLKWQKEFVVVFVGRPSKGKGLHTLLEAIRALDCKLLIVGSFVDDDYFKKMARDLGIEKKVHFAGKIEHDDLADYYRAGDVFCVPSTIFEGQGIVFLEAMACGIPVITTKVPAIMDTVGLGAILVEKENANQLKNAISKLMANPSLRGNLKKEGLLQSQKFARPLIMRQYLKELLKA